MGHLGRLAVRPETRGTGLGVDLVAAVEARAAERGLRVMVLSAQTHALGFYERLGYAAYGPVFDDAGLPHRWMRRSPLTRARPPRPHSVTNRERGVTFCSRNRSTVQYLPRTQRQLCARGWGAMR